MERRHLNEQRKDQNVIAFRKRCTPGGTGLTHYILLGDAPKPSTRSSSRRRGRQVAKV